MYDQSKLSELILFACVAAGSTVIDVYPGDGDWTRVFFDVVGPEGRVYSFVPTEIVHVKSDSVDRMRALANEPGRDNVEAVSADLVAMPEATRPADVVWLHLFYHDLHTSLIQSMGATATGFNRAVYERLKPGGFYVIVDHAAAAGAGTSDTQSLHRIDPVSVREEEEDVDKWNIVGSSRTFSGRVQMESTTYAQAPCPTRDISYYQECRRPGRTDSSELQTYFSSYCSSVKLTTRFAHA